MTLRRSSLTINSMMVSYMSPLSNHLGTKAMSSTAQIFSPIATKENKASNIVPRAAVAATIQWTCPRTNENRYLLIQRKNPPDKGKWSCAGGKIELGEKTLDAARREVREETQIRDCRWHSNSFFSTDAIVAADKEKGNDENEDASRSYIFHYVIAHCFGKAPACSSGVAPEIVPSDDALDAKWCTLAEIRDLECSEHTIEVVQRAEELSDLGLLPI